MRVHVLTVRRATTARELVMWCQTASVTQDSGVLAQPLVPTHTTLAFQLEEMPRKASFIV